MNRQEAFDKVWQAFIVEKQPLGHNGVVCVYYGEHNGLVVRCAIGQLLPLEEARKLLGCDDSLRDLLDNPSSPVFHIADLGISFLEDLQYTHDKAASPTLCDIQGELLRFADKYRLSSGSNLETNYE